MITHFFFFSFPGYILLVLPSQLKRHHLLEIRLLVHRLAQLFILCAHFVLGSDTPVDSTLLYIIKSVCLFLPLDFLSPLSFWGADTENYTLLYPHHRVSPQTDPCLSGQHRCGLVGKQRFWGKTSVGFPPTLTVSAMLVPCPYYFPLSTITAFIWTSPVPHWTPGVHHRLFLLSFLVSNDSFPYVLCTQDQSS